MRKDLLFDQALKFIDLARHMREYDIRVFPQESDACPVVFASFVYDEAVVLAIICSIAIPLVKNLLCEN